MLGRLKDFSAVIDARSEGEFARTACPRRQWPSLNDEERKIVGTRYKRSPFEAKKLSRRWWPKTSPRTSSARCWTKPGNGNLDLCGAGGRSGSLALILDQIGFRVTLVDGGYRLPGCAGGRFAATRASCQFRSCAGPPGRARPPAARAGQTGAQVLDLEALANHRSSVRPDPWRRPAQPERPLKARSGQRAWL